MTSPTFGGKGTGGELDKLVDALRHGTVDLAHLNRPATDTQIQAMVDVCLLHHREHLDVISECSCGWKTPVLGKHFEALEREYLAHIMADIVERVFSKPTNSLTGH